MCVSPLLEPVPGLESSAHTNTGRNQSVHEMVEMLMMELVKQANLCCVCRFVYSVSDDVNWLCDDDDDNKSDCVCVCAMLTQHSCHSQKTKAKNIFIIRIHRDDGESTPAMTMCLPRDDDGNFVYFIHERCYLHTSVLYSSDSSHANELS